MLKKSHIEQYILFDFTYIKKQKKLIFGDKNQECDYFVVKERTGEHIRALLSC